MEIETKNEITKASNNHLRNLKIWIAGAVFLIVIILIGVVALLVESEKSLRIAIKSAQYSHKAAQTATTTDEMKDWKTYRNEEFGFEFRYPQDWGFEEKEGGVFLTAPDDDMGSGTINIIPNSKNEILNEPNIVTVKEEQKIFNNTSWTVIVKQEVMEPTVEFYLAETSRNGIAYMIGTRNFYESAKIIDQILSTFKFTEPAADTSGWRMYRNEEYGFEVKFPGRWLKVDQEHDSFPYEHEVFFFYINDDAPCFISIYSDQIYPGQVWDEIKKDESLGPLDLSTKNGKTLGWGWGCGQDDYGYRGFEEYNHARDRGDFEAINSGRILGPYQEFEKLILPTFKFMK